MNKSLIVRKQTPKGEVVDNDFASRNNRKDTKGAINAWSTGTLRVRRADRTFYVLSYERRGSEDLRV